MSAPAYGAENKRLARVWSVEPFEGSRRERESAIVLSVLRLACTRGGADSPGSKIDSRGWRTKPESKGGIKAGPPGRIGDISRSRDAI